MTHLGAQLEAVEPGLVEIVLPFQQQLTQQHDFLHAGAISAAVDSACGYAALTLSPPATAILSIEFKVNLLAPAKGEHFLARGRVLRPGRNITVCQGEGWAYVDGGQVQVLSMLATMMNVRDRPLVD